jgi:hypothetical protein
VRRVTVGAWCAALLSAATHAAPAYAQGISPDCTVTPAVVGNPADICRKAADLWAFVVPQVGVALAGGNAILGEGGTLGGWGKRSVTLRVTAVDGRLPKNTVPLTLNRSTATGDDFGATRAPVPMASLDAAIGVFAGAPLGLTNVGGIDALVGVTAISDITKDRLALSPAGSKYAVSYGVRIGALQESSLVPGLSVSYVRRKVPTLNVDYTPSNDTLAVRNASLTANALRVVISKRLTIFGLALGVGRDDIEGVTGVRAVVNEPVLGIAQRVVVTFPTLQQKVQRNTAFVNASVGLLAARLVAEYGRSSAGTLRQTLNTFGGHAANEAYSYGSVGLTVRF